MELEPAQYYILRARKGNRVTGSTSELMRGQGEQEMFFPHTVFFLLPFPCRLHQSRESIPDGLGLAVAAWLCAHHSWAPRKHLLKGVEHHTSSPALRLLPRGLGGRSSQQAEGGPLESAVFLGLTLLLYKTESITPTFMVIIGKSRKWQMRACSGHFLLLLDPC